MALLDISAVTRALTDFVARSVEISPAWQPRPRPVVSPLPPDLLQSAGLSFYLFHLGENAQLRNASPPDPAAQHVRHISMALDLHYQMSATPGGNTANDLLESQLLMGCALKALHDQPVIHDATQVNGTAILAAAGLDNAENRLRLVLQPISSNDAVTYWTAGTQALRLSSYYLCGVVLLEPEPLDRRAGRVFRYGITTFVTGSPRLIGSRATLNVTLPDGTPQSIEVSPAVVPYDGEFELLGYDLAGEASDLLLRDGRSPTALVADANWAVSVQPTSLLAIARTTIDGQTLLPGVYTAAVRTSKTVSSRVLQRSSNETPIQIAPTVSAIAPLGGGSFQVDGGLFADAAIAPERRQVFLGADPLAQVTGAPAAGEYRVVDAGRIELALPAGAAAGQDLPLRIIVNGAESPPRWIRVP